MSRPACYVSGRSDRLQDVRRSTETTLGGLGLAIAVCAGFALLPRLFSPAGGPLVGHDAPDFTLPIVANSAAVGLDGTTLTLSDLRGKAVLLDFWATWCGPCRAQIPIVDQVARRWRHRGVVVLGVSTDSIDDGDLRQFAVARGVTYPILQDGVGLASRSYDVENLPTLVVVSPAGKVVAVRTGVTEDAELERIIRRAL